jgi:hypothetical protein
MVSIPKPATFLHNKLSFRIAKILYSQSEHAGLKWSAQLMPKRSLYSFSLGIMGNGYGYFITVLFVICGLMDHYM